MKCEKCGELLGENDTAYEFEVDPTVEGERWAVTCKSCAEEIFPR